MRQFNLIGRGEKETRRDFIARIKGRLQAIGLATEPLTAEGDLLRYEIGCLEVGDGVIACIAPDGRMIASIPAEHGELAAVQSFGGFGGAQLRFEVDPMTPTRAAKILAPFTNGAGQLRDDVTVRELTAEQLEAFAFAAKLET